MVMRIQIEWLATKTPDGYLMAARARGYAVVYADLPPDMVADWSQIMAISDLMAAELARLCSRGRLAGHSRLELQGDETCS
jgi:hypothetical protein